jgi:hypothetical protein
MPSKPQWPTWYIDEALSLLWSGLSGQKAVDRLAELYPEMAGDHARVRTVLSWGERWPDDGSGAWSIADNHGVDAALVLPVLARVTTESGGRRTSVTRDEARYISRIRQAAPELDLWRVWRLARRCSSARAANRSTPEVDAFLAYAPWRGDPRPYVDAVTAGWIEGLDMDLFAGAGTAGAVARAHNATVEVEEQP